MHLFRFANPDYFYLLLLLPVMLALFIINRFRINRNIRKIGDKRLVNDLLPEYSTSRPIIKFILMSLIMVFGTIMLARPQFGSKIEDVQKQGVEIVIALDISNSMLAQDIQPDRLTRAKQAISRLVDNLENDRIGLIVFAGAAYTQIPITTDYVSAKMFLSSISPEMASRQGTAVGAAIDLGARSFSPNNDRSKAMIIITDGENHDDDPIAAAREAAKAGIVVHVIGIGTERGAPIPVTVNGRRDFLRDIEGNTVITRLNEDILKQIALETNGSYVNANNSSIGLDEIFREIKKMDTQEFESAMFTEYNDQFQIFAAIALLLLLIEFIVMDRKNRTLANIRLFKFKV
jgi:Ca-activated chloride channel family protein